jgi:hypothetical protein
MKTTKEFPVPAINFRERDKLFRPTTPILASMLTNFFFFVTDGGME